MTPLEQARSFAQGGNLTAAVETLERAGDAGHADCLVDLGFIYLQGTGVPRNLGKSRECFARASELGSPGARSIYISFLANGTGGASNFPAAVRMLADTAAGDPGAKRQLALIKAMDLTDDGYPHELPQPRPVSDRPFVRLFPQLLTEDECRYLAEAAEPAFRRAHVGSVASGQILQSQVRTCDVAAFPWVAENPAIHAINRRIAAASDFAVECGEPLQILRYRPGQEFKPHFDHTEATGNQRVLTMLVYLNEEYTGGETLFLKTGQKVRGETGDGLLFRNTTADGRPDQNSLHAGLPVTSGEKLIASRWIRQKRFGPAA